MNIGKIALTFFLCVLSFLKPVKHLSILLLKLLLRKKYMTSLTWMLAGQI